MRSLTPRIYHSVHLIPYWNDNEYEYECYLKTKSLAQTIHGSLVKIMIFHRSLFYRILNTFWYGIIQYFIALWQIMYLLICLIVITNIVISYINKLHNLHYIERVCVTVKTYGVCLTSLHDIIVFQGFHTDILFIWQFNNDI